MIFAYEVATGRITMAEVGFDHTTPCCYGSFERLIAVSDRYLAFTSLNGQLVPTGDDDLQRLYRAEIPLWTP
ncbi:MAG TPA: hypothetical protein VFD39_11605 [Trueperaceae bacterium]|nr:hypothetical protein [Trueperaceae bacterium]